MRNLSNNQRPMSNRSNQSRFESRGQNSERLVRGRLSPQYIEERHRIKVLVENGLDIYKISEKVGISSLELINCCNNDPQILNLYNARMEEKYDESRESIADIIKTGRSLYDVSREVEIPYLSFMKSYYKDSKMIALRSMVIKAKYSAIQKDDECREFKNQ